MSLPGFIVFDNNLPDTPMMYGTNKIDVVTTTPYTLGTIKYIIIVNSTSPITINLPAAIGQGRIYYIKNVNTGVVTVDGSGSETIDGELTQTINQWETMPICDYATGTWIIL